MTSRSLFQLCRGSTFPGANPLIKSILTSADDLLPYLTTRSSLVLAMAGPVIVEWAATHLPGHDPGVVALAADSIVRLVVSHIVQPSSDPSSAPLSALSSARTADELTEVLVRLLAA
ncbi:hypothetical protein [Dactylosporangium sp. NPDC005555]|uniref:hypothetical protein n=1 Tax=Dactylosporangium sp. NPDC005555 TaxID=3154889 RepID=UPI0033ADB36D